MKITDPVLRKELTDILEAGGIEDAALEAQWIAEDIPDAEKAREIARRRAQHEPLQYLLGTWEFYGLTLRVGKGVLIPRADTETLVDAVLSRLPQTPKPEIADLCTGSGCIALALKSQRRDAEIIGIEKSHDAMQYAVINEMQLSLGVQFFHGDVTDPAVYGLFRGLDAVVSNPPYLTAEDMRHLQPEVTYEPETALAGGEDGLCFYRIITEKWKGALKPGGLLAYEAGIGQADAVAEILRANGFTGIEQIADLNGIARVILGFKDEQSIR